MMQFLRRILFFLFFPFFAHLRKSLRHTTSWITQTVPFSPFNSCLALDDELPNKVPDSPTDISMDFFILLNSEELFYVTAREHYKAWWVMVIFEGLHHSSTEFAAQ